MNLTPEEKKRICERMDWPYYEPDCDCGICSYCNGLKRNKAFSLNDAGLVVAELRKQGKLDEFEKYCFTVSRSGYYFMSEESGEATNFFRSYYEFIKQEEGKW